MADGRMARRPPPRERRDGAQARTPEGHRQPYIPPQPGIPEPYATPEEPGGPTRGAPYRSRRASPGGYDGGRASDDTGEWRYDQPPGAGGAGPRGAAGPPQQYSEPDAWSAPPDYGTGAGYGYDAPPPNGHGSGPPTGGGYGPPTNGYGPSEYRATPNGYGSPGEGHRAPPPNGYGHTNGYGQPPVDQGPATDGRGFRRPRSHRTPSAEYGPQPRYGDPRGGYRREDGYPDSGAHPGWQDSRPTDGWQRGDQHADWIRHGDAAARPVTPHETGRWSSSRGSWVPAEPARDVPDFAIGRFEETRDMRRGPARGGPRVVDGVDWSERMDQRPAWQPHTWDDAPTSRSTDWSEVPLPPPRPRTEPRMRAATTATERDPAADKLLGEAVPAGTIGATLSPLLWFALAIGAYLAAVFVFNDGPERAEAFRAAIGLLPWFGVASTMSVGLALALRWIGAGWRATGLGFAAAVVSGTVTTIVHSLLAG